MNRPDTLLPMNLPPRHLQNREVRKFPNRAAIAFGEHLGGVFTARARVPALAPGQHNARRHALDVPFPRPANGLIEIVEIENQRPIRRRERSQILHMRVTAQLHRQSRMRQPSQIRRHDRNRTAKERER